MKYNIPIVYFLLSSFLIVSCSTQTSEKKKAYNKDENKSHNPIDLWLQQRANLETFDSKSYLENMTKISKSKHQHFAKKTLSTLDSVWVEEGPGNIGGRFNALAMLPTNHNIIYAGAANGGVFKTTDGGNSWNPIFDDLSYLAIGAIEIDPTNEETVYVGTGDRNFGGGSHLGNGIYKSTNGGTSWQQSGLAEASIVSKIVINPENTEQLFAATLGNVHIQDNNRGVYKSNNGGDTWENVLYISDSTGAVDLIMHPTDTNILYASTYTRYRTNFESVVEGPEVGIYKTIDGGNTWTELTSGLPTDIMCRIGLAITPHGTVYASYTGTDYDIEDVYKSTNDGDTWTGMDVYNHNLGFGVQGNFGWYFGEVYANPYHQNQLIIPGVDMYVTNDDGNFWYSNVPPWYTYEVHADKHAIVFLDSLSYIIATDGGLYKTTDNGENWTDIENIPVTQFYHIDVDKNEPGTYGGGAQDNGSISGNQSIFNSWNKLFGGDGFRIHFLEENEDAHLYETQNGGLVYMDLTSALTEDLSPFIDADDRVNWDMPYAVNELDDKLYIGTSKIWEMESFPYNFYQEISPDLTQVASGAYEGLASRHTITEIAQPDSNTNMLFVGTSDGLVWRGQKNLAGLWDWTDISANLPNRYVTALRTSPNNAQTLYVGFSGYKINDLEPYLYKSTDNGNTWSSISGNIPNMIVNDVLEIKNVDGDNLFAAIDGGVYYTNDGGTSWQPIGVDLPLVTVSELDVDVENEKLIAGTYSRSMYSYPINWLFEDTQPPVGVTEDVQIDFEVYPNPFSNLIEIKHPEPNLIEIFNVHGQIVYSTNTLESKQVNLSHLSTGTYFIKIGQKTKKIVKQ